MQAKRGEVTDNLEQLGPNGFQNLAAALLIGSLGPGWQAMGAGKDGGRDVYHRGPLAWGSETEGGRVWDGYTVAQVKHHASDVWVVEWSGVAVVTQGGGVASR